MITPEVFYRDLEAMLELEPERIQGNESLDALEWDSMAVVMFIAMADEKYSAVIAPSQLSDAKTVPDLLALVTAAAG
jgi:acyl carrier protein